MYCTGTIQEATQNYLHVLNGIILLKDFPHGFLQSSEITSGTESLGTKLGMAYRSES